MSTIRRRLYGEYMVGKAADWQTFATEFGLDVQTIMPLARKSITQTSQGDWLYLVELWDTDFHEVLRAWKTGLLPLKQWQASQLGQPFVQLRDKAGNRLMDDSETLVGTGKNLLPWIFAMTPQMPDDLTEQQIKTYVVQNNLKDKLKALFDAFEYDDDLI